MDVLGQRLVPWCTDLMTEDSPVREATLEAILAFSHEVQPPDAA